MQSEIILIIVGSMITAFFAIAGYVVINIKDDAKVSMERISGAMDRIADDVGEMKIAVGQHFTEISNHKETTKERFAALERRLEKR
jgi:hypothetical protein